MCNKRDKSYYTCNTYNLYVSTAGTIPKEVSFLSLQTDVETRAEGQTRALPPSWARWLICRLSVVRTFTRTRKKDPSSVDGGPAHVTSVLDKLINHSTMTAIVVSSGLFLRKIHL